MSSPLTPAENEYGTFSHARDGFNDPCGFPHSDPQNLSYHKTVSPLSKLTMIIAFIALGSFVTLVSKSIYDAGFPFPWTLNLLMSFGMSLAIPAFLMFPSLRGTCTAPAPTSVTSPLSPGSSILVDITIPPLKEWIFGMRVVLPCAACDVIAGGLMNMGLIGLSASTWQMMRGSVVLFTLMLRFFLFGSRTFLHEGIGAALVILGLIVVGAASLGDAREVAGIPAWMTAISVVLVLLSQAFSAGTMVLEEHLTKRVNLPVPVVVGLQGVWGLIINAGVLSVVSNIPPSDCAVAFGWSEPFTSIPAMLYNNPMVATLLLGYVLTVGFYNYFGTAITAHTTAATHTVVDQARILVVWVAMLNIYMIAAPSSSPYGGRDTETYSQVTVPYAAPELEVFRSNTMGATALLSAVKQSVPYNTGTYTTDGRRNRAGPNAQRNGFANALDEPTAASDSICHTLAVIAVGQEAHDAIATGGVMTRSPRYPSTATRGGRNAKSKKGKTKPLPLSDVLGDEDDLAHSAADVQANTKVGAKKISAESEQQSRYGERISRWSLVELAGFLLMTAGVLIFEGVVTLPRVSYPTDEEKDSAQGTVSIARIRVNESLLTSPPRFTSPTVPPPSAFPAANVGVAAAEAGARSHPLPAVTSAGATPDNTDGGRYPTQMDAPAQASAPAPAAAAATPDVPPVVNTGAAAAAAQAPVVAASSSGRGKKKSKAKGKADDETTSLLRK